MLVFCPVCGTRHNSVRNERFCSEECRTEYKKIKQKEYLENYIPPSKPQREQASKVCPYCKNIFYPKHRNDQIYCSEKCRDKAKWENKRKPLSERVCLVCGIVFMPSTGKQQCCSSKCGFRKIYFENADKHKQRSKEWRKNNPERARENDRRKRERDKEKYRKIEQKHHDLNRFSGNRELVLRRDGYRCVLCGAEGGLGVHHKDCSGQTDNPNNEPDNLITVCKSCHTKQHNPRLNTTPHTINNCQMCGNEIRVSQVRIEDGRGKFCSKKCHNASMVKKVVITCQQCGEDFEVLPSRIKRGKVKYCSMECRKAAGYATRIKV